MRNIKFVSVLHFSFQFLFLYRRFYYAEKAKQIVVDYFNKHVDVTGNKKITVADVFIVWFSKTLQNWKALVSTTVNDGMYYEITHNGDKGYTYVDVYKKRENFTVK